MPDDLSLPLPGEDDFALPLLGDGDFVLPIEAQMGGVEAPAAPRPSSPRVRALSLASAPALERPRRRQGVPSRPVHAEPAEEGPGADDIRHEHMRAALRMEIEGRTEEEIAHHFGHHVSTIRQWLYEARQMRREDFLAVGADDALAEMQDSIRARLTIARRRMRDAIAAGDDRLLDLWMGRITDLEEQHLAFLDRIGAIDALRADRMPDPSAG